MALLNKPKTNFRWQPALIDDPCLWLVPWSQSRYRTDEERDRHRDLPGMENVVLKRGQTLFWDGNTIYRGKLPPGGKERLVLAGGLCKYDPDEPKLDPDNRFQWRVAENRTCPAKPGAAVVGTLAGPPESAPSGAMSLVNCWCTPYLGEIAHHSRTSQQGSHLPQCRILFT